MLVSILILLVFLFRYMNFNYKYGYLGSKDFIAYWGAGQLLKAGENPYDFVRLDQLQSKLASSPDFPIVIYNPPWILVWLYPLILLPFNIAALIWLGLNYGIILACATILSKLQAGPSTFRSVGIAWLASMAFVPSLHALYMGQVSSLLLLGITGFLYWSARGWDFLAGLALALTTIKPHVVYLLWIALPWWIIVERRWKILAGVATPLLMAIALLATHWPVSLRGYRTVLSHPPLFYKTPTLGGVLRLWLSPDDPRLQFLVPIIVGLSFLAFLVVRRPALDWRTALAPILLVSVPTAAYGYTFDQIVLLVPYLAIVTQIADNAAFDRRKLLLLVGLVLTDGIMAIQGFLHMEYWLYFWAPWALIILYNIYKL
jgi:hypothetical protein